MKCYIKDIFDFKRDKISITDLCKQVGISRTTFYNIIESKKEPSVTLAIRITEYLNECLEKLEYNYVDWLYDVYDLWKED